MDRGIVVAFDAKRGFGFIRSRAYRDDVFVHASAVDGGGGLSVGQSVTFEAEAAERGPRARRVEPGRRGLSPDRSAALFLLMSLLCATYALHRQGVGWIGAWLVGVNLATWPAYAWDKHRALRDGRRVPELALLGLALLGGSPAAAVAMMTLRHKTRKPSFLIPFAGVVLVQLVLIGVVFPR
jgi:uncharacterized membrane protein YsdA (DUF1294 family)/cold shock CspA family protein